MWHRDTKLAAIWLLAIALIFGAGEAFDVRSQTLLLLGAGKGVVSGGFTASCTESTNFLARTSGLDTTHKTNYDTLICGLVTDGNFSKLDVLYILATDTRTNAVLNLVQNNFNATENGTVSFSADHGYTGDGSTFFLDSGFNPNTASSPKYVLNSASIGVYILSNITTGLSAGYGIGASNVGEAKFDAFFFSTIIWDVNNVTTANPASTTSQGQWIATRTASNAAALYRNSSTTAFDTSSTNSTAVPQNTFYVFGTNATSSHTLSLPSAAQMSAAIIGSALSNTEQASVANRINTYMTSYGINVYHHFEDGDWAWLNGNANDNDVTPWRQVM